VRGASIGVLDRLALAFWRRAVRSYRYEREKEGHSKRWRERSRQPVRDTLPPPVPGAAFWCAGAARPLLESGSHRDCVYWARSRDIEEPGSEFGGGSASGSAVRRSALSPARELRRGHRGGVGQAALLHGLATRPAGDITGCMGRVTSVTRVRLANSSSMPCASSRAGLRALRRTADPLASPRRNSLPALNCHGCGPVLRSLYGCQTPVGVWQRLHTRMQRLGTGVAMYLGLVVYFFLHLCCALPSRVHYR